MIVIKFIFLVLGVIFLLGLMGGLVMVVGMYRLRKNMEKAFHNAQDARHDAPNDIYDHDPNEPLNPHGNVNGDFDMTQCPHCGTFTPAAEQYCEHCGGKL